MLRREMAILAFAIGCVSCLQTESRAQLGGFGAGGFNTPSRFSRTVGQQILDRPTVSPYLNLAYWGGSTVGSGAVIPTYQSMVRPQMEARRQSEMQAQQLRALQSQVSNIREEFRQQQQQGGITTGHATRYGMHSHYFPQLDQMRQ